MDSAENVEGFFPLTAEFEQSQHLTRYFTYLRLIHDQALKIIIKSGLNSNHRQLW